LIYDGCAGKGRFVFHLNQFFTKIVFRRKTAGQILKPGFSIIPQKYFAFKSNPLTFAVPKI
jgi:hypothetical protein